MKKTINFSDERGFTLVEATVALVFLLVVFVGIAPLLVYAINYNSGAAVRAGALGVAQKNWSSFARPLLMNVPQLRRQSASATQLLRFRPMSSRRRLPMSARPSKPFKCA
jgi:hypothetical protein